MINEIITIAADIPLIRCQCGASKNEIELFVCELCADTCCVDCLLTCFSCNRKVCMQCKGLFPNTACIECDKAMGWEKPQEFIVYIVVAGIHYLVNPDNGMHKALVESTICSDHQRLSKLEIKNMGVLYFSYSAIRYEDSNRRIYDLHFSRVPLLELDF